MNEFIATTTDSIEGYQIRNYLGIVSGEVVLGVNVLKDWFASLRDEIGGRVASYEDSIKDGEKEALAIMADRAKSIGANAIVGIRFDHEVLSPRGKGTVLVVVCSGTAVYLEAIDNTRQYWQLEDSTGIL